MAGSDNVWVADAVAHRLHRLTFNGDRLRWVETLPFAFTTGPQALAIAADGQLAVADGNQVMFFSSQPGYPLQEVWLAPNSGGLGPFRQISALAFGPDGDLAVAEAGNLRVSFILRSQPRYQVMWPLLMAP